MTDDPRTVLAKAREWLNNIAWKSITHGVAVDLCDALETALDDAEASHANARKLAETIETMRVNGVALRERAERLAAVARQSGLMCRSAGVLAEAALQNIAENNDDPTVFDLWHRAVETTKETRAALAALQPGDIPEDGS